MCFHYSITETQWDGMGERDYGSKPVGVVLCLTEVLYLSWRVFTSWKNNMKKGQKTDFILLHTKWQIRQNNGLLQKFNVLTISTCVQVSQKADQYSSAWMTVCTPGEGSILHHVWSTAITVIDTKALMIETSHMTENYCRDTFDIRHFGRCALTVLGQSGNDRCVYILCVLSSLYVCVYVKKCLNSQIHLLLIGEMSD